MSEQQDIVFVTGPAGAGRTTTIKILEDFGMETIDNLPLNMVSRILSGTPTPSALAIGLDTRTRGFSSIGLLELMENIKQSTSYKPTLLYLDCQKSILLKRFSETRRRHPASPDGSPEAGIEYEAGLLADLKTRADILLDTSEITPHQLKSRLERWFLPDKPARISVTVLSFSYKRGVPQGADLMFDCRFLKNPHWQPELRARTGLSKEVGEYIAKDPLFSPFFSQLIDFSKLLLPAYQAEGKAYLSIALGCTGGQHRSVFVAEQLAQSLEQAGWSPRLMHREMQRWPRKEAET